MILAIASVEALTPDEFWTDTQKKILQSLTESAKAYPGASEREIEEIIARVNGLPKLSINQAFRRFLDRLGIEDIWPAWRDAYNARSRILHGDAPPEEVIRTIDTTMRLSREIILKAAEHEFSETKVTARESPVSKDS
jgi:hypothetical protein